MRRGCVRNRSLWAFLGLCLVVGGIWGGASAVRAQDTGLATLVADRLFIEGAERLVAEGNVEMLLRNARLQANRVVYDRATDTLTVEGPIVLSQGEETVILAEQAELAGNLETGLIRSARVVFDQQLQIAAGSVVRRDERFTEMTAVVASSCEVCSETATPLWDIRARRIIHDDEELQIYFEGARFSLFGLPVLYIPRLRVPDPRLERATGLLSPQFSVESGHGFGLRAPYFIVLGPDRDLLLTPYISVQGTRALEARYRQAFATGMLEFGGLVARDTIRPDETRAAGFASGSFALGRGYALRFNLVHPSDKRVLEDYGRGAARLTNDVTVERVERDLRIRAQALRFRSLRLDDVMSRPPNAVGQGVFERRFDMPGIGGIGGARLEAHAHERKLWDDALGPPLPRQSGRFSLDLDWRRDAVLPGGIIGTAGLHLGLDHFELSQTEGRFPNSDTRLTPNLMAELRWPLVRGGAGGEAQVIEPVVQVIWGRDRAGRVPNEASRMPELDEGNLFSFDRFAGRDEREAGLRANLGLNWTLYDPAGWSSTLTLGRIWRARDLEQFSDASPLSGSTSDWLVAASFDTMHGLQISNRSLFSSDLHLQRTALELDWSGELYTLSTSYMRIQRDPDEGRARTASEWRMDAVRRVDDTWTARVGWRYDVEQRRTAHTTFGLDYENECLRMRFEVERQFASPSTPSALTSLGLSVDVLGVGGNPGRARRQACSGP